MPGVLVIRAAVSNYLLEPPVAVFDLSWAGFCWSCAVVLLLILVFGVLIYRMLHWFLVSWVLILSIWMLGIVLRVLRCSFLVVHRASI
jgi:hypothetical protein